MTTGRELATREQLEFVRPLVEDMALEPLPPRPLNPVKPTTKKRKRTARKRTAPKPSLPPPSTRIASVIGIVMPVFSCLFTGAAGSLWLKAATAPAVTLAVAGIAGLLVSLSHVAEAIRYATGTKQLPSFALAIAFELGIVAIELGRVTAPGALSPILSYAMTAGIAILVAGLNVYAFRLHAHRVQSAL